MKIPFNQSSLEGRELQFIFQSVASGKISGDQLFSRKCHGLLEEVTGARRALVTTSCTHALEMTKF
jgi:dTDP-4-amino-4,6-dideoxygalactose transaminase